MKYLIIFFTFFIALNVSAQQSSSEFIRVFDINGKRIAKGKIQELTDTSVILKNNPGVNLPVNNIGFIKSKRSNKHNVLIGTATGGVFGLLGLASASNGPTTGFAGGASRGIAVVGSIVFTALGAGVGYLTTLFKKSETYMINGDLVKWMNFKETIMVRTNN